MDSGHLSQKQRTLALFVNIFAALCVHRAVSGRWYVTSDVADSWIVAAIAFWVLALLSAPFFRPPKDSLANALAAVIALMGISVAKYADASLLLGAIRGVGIALCLLVVTLSVFAISAHSTARESAGSLIAYRVSNELGRGQILFTPVVLISVFAGYSSDLPALLSLMVFWTLAVSCGLAEFVIGLWGKLVPNRKNLSPQLLGAAARFDSPGVVRVLLAPAAKWSMEDLWVFKGPNRKVVCLLPLYENPAIEGRLATAVVASAWPDDDAARSTELGVYKLENAGSRIDRLAELSGLGQGADLAGIVVEGSTISSLRFEATDPNLTKGTIVSVSFSGRSIFYQITEASTAEEVLSAQLHGRRIAMAIQLGEFQRSRGFSRFDWVPEMNSMVFRVPPAFDFAFEPQPDQLSIGVLPGTSGEVFVDIDEIVHYHAAVLGVTGTGKTELTLDIVRGAVARGCKVICVDFTGEYAKRLSDLDPLQLGLTRDLGRAYEDAIFAVETGQYGAGNEKAALKRFVDEIRPQINSQVADFVSGDHRLAILELAEITNTKATLRTTELYLSSFMDWAKSHRREKRILLVLEEAHTIVPETGGSGMDFESKWVVERIGQIALQGRKYGIGLLVVSQRTALVSKTILSQCNSFFTFCLVDQTSLGFLTSVFSADHVAGIPNLKTLELMAYGRAISAERPILVQRKFDESKATASAQLDSQEVRATNEGGGS